MPPTAYIRTNLFPSNIGTSRSISIPTSPATLVVMNSGYMGWRWTNLGPSLSLAFGDSNIAIGTGSLLFYSMSKEWYPVVDTMAAFVIADSVAGLLRVDEYL